jgi:hypothetical protein
MLKSLVRLSRFSWLKPQFVAVVIIAALLGYVVAKSLAASPSVAFEPETGIVSAGAIVQTVSAASGTGVVKFAASPTPAATPTPTGSPTDRTCPAYPAAPNDACTGVPTGTATTTVTGDLTTTTAGQIIDAKSIKGDLIVNHANVMVKNTRVYGRIVNNASSGLTITDSDIGPDAYPTSSSFYNNLNGSGYTLIRSRVHHAGADLIGIGGNGTILIRDSLINKACFYPGDHLDAAQFYAPGDVGMVTIEHSLLDSRPTNTTGYGNAAIFWADNPGPGSRLTVTQSFLAGGNYTASLYDAGAGSGVILDIHNSTFTKNSYQYGACASSNSVPYNGTAGLIFTGNKYDDGSAVSGC